MTNESVRRGYSLMNRVEKLDGFLSSGQYHYLKWGDCSLYIDTDNAPEVFITIQKYKERLEKELEELK